MISLKEKSWVEYLPLRPKFYSFDLPGS